MWEKTSSLLEYGNWKMERIAAWTKNLPETMNKFLPAYFQKNLFTIKIYRNIEKGNIASIKAFQSKEIDNWNGWAESVFEFQNIYLYKLFFLAEINNIGKKRSLYKFITFFKYCLIFQL